MDKKRRNKISFVTTLFGLIANALLCAGKFAVGLLCGNIAVTADAVNNLSDAGNNVVTLIAIKVAGKPADKEHPFGHERVEYISALVVAFIILFLGVELAVSSVEKIILNFKEPYLPEFDAWLVYVLSFSVVVKVVMFFVYRTNGKKAQSPVLKAMALDSIMDVAATAAVLAAILIGRLASVNLDGYMGLAVSVLIFVGGIKIAKDTVSGLIGVAPDKKLIAELEAEIAAYDGVLGVHDLLVHSYGPYNTFVTVHAEVDAKADMLAAHERIDRIERDFLEKRNIHLLVHLDPTEKDNPEIEAVLPSIKEVLSSVADGLNFHDVRLVRQGGAGKIFFDMVAPFELEKSDEELKNLAESRLFEKTGMSFSVTVDRERLQKEKRFEQSRRNFYPKRKRNFKRRLFRPKPRRSPALEGRDSRAHNKKVWYRQPLRPERRVSDNHFEAHLFQDLHRRNALDLAEKIQ